MDDAEIADIVEAHRLVLAKISILLDDLLSILETILEHKDAE
jgi:hypothetical protein